MTTAIALSPYPSTGTVGVTVTVSGGSVVTSVQRRDVNGLRAVRVPTGLVPSTGGFVLVDTEASLKGPITYQVVTTVGREATASTALDVPGWYLVDPMLPTGAQPLPLVEGLTSVRASATTFHEVVGREDPVPVVGPLRRRSGVMDLWCASYEDGLSIVALYATRRILMLRQGTFGGLDLYHLPESVDLSPQPADTSPKRWRVGVSYREVAVPTGPLLSQPGWTYADVLAAYSSYDDLLVAFPTYAALLLKEPS